MANDFYQDSGNPATGASGSSALIRAEFAAIEAGFDKLPGLTGNGAKLVKINTGGTAMEASKVTVTEPATSATLTIADGKTLTSSNTLTLAGTDGTTMTFPSASGAVVTEAATQTLTNKTLTSPTLTTPSVNGIKFAADAPNIADANTLDDYEEGTYTPTPTGLTVVGTPTYSGKYIKIGRMIHVNVTLAATTSTASTALITYIDLPFPAELSTANRWVASVCSYDLSVSANGLVRSNTACYLPTWSATASNIQISFSYMGVA